MNIERPLDLLNNSKGKTVLVYCKDNKIYSGLLIAFDIHINLALDRMKIVSEEGNGNNFGLGFIRGDSINFISPSVKKE